MLTFIKLGGSVITDKRAQEAANLPTIGRLARELSTARNAVPEQTLLVGHGSGSFGHTHAARYGIHRGLPADTDWMGYALTARAAQRLNRIVVDALLASGIPALTIQPSAALYSINGQPAHWQIDTIAYALRYRLVPVVYGDVAFDTRQGSAIISTESLFAYLALHTDVRPGRLILVGEHAIYTADPAVVPDAQIVPLITEQNISEVMTYTGDSHGVDVTGGMRDKLSQMWKLIEALPELEVYIIGAEPGALTSALLGQTPQGGTVVRKR